MLNKDEVEQVKNQQRTLRRTLVGAKVHDEQPNDKEAAQQLGPLALLVGEWVSLPGHGWNMIALPFGGPTNKGLNYRLLLNQYNETLTFDELAGPVPNRGIAKTPCGNVEEADQFIGAIQYFQKIDQIAVGDFPPSTLGGEPGATIHEETGMWLHMTNETTAKLDIARMGTIPHGDTVLGLGTGKEFQGAPDIPDISGLPLGVNDSLDDPYLLPYRHFNDNLFQTVFNPVHPNHLLFEAIQNQNIVKTTELCVATNVQQAGVTNIPFVEKQADATEMQFSFWIEELDEKDAEGNPILQLQYSQTVFLDFFDSPLNSGKIRWPHVSINTLRRKDQIPK